MKEFVRFKKRDPLDPATQQEIIKNILDGWSISVSIKKATGEYNTALQKWIFTNYPKIKELYELKRLEYKKTAKMCPINAQLNKQIMRENQERLKNGLEPLPLINSYLNGRRKKT
jgi:hypothetical protein